VLFKKSNFNLLVLWLSAFNICNTGFAKIDSYKQAVAIARENHFFTSTSGLYFLISAINSSLLTGEIIIVSEFLNFSSSRRKESAGDESGLLVNFTDFNC
jgi:hypothetical protein